MLQLQINNRVALSFCNRPLEAHVVIKKASLPDIERVKTDLKRVLHEQFKVSHSTLEMELDGSVCIDTRQADNHRSEA